MNKKIHLIANAHLDPVWLWHWQDGCNEVLQTFRSAVDRLNEYDKLIFNCSSAQYYKWVEEIEPAMFSEIQDKVKCGRWNIVGGWAVQPDCNMPSGESFARQSLYNQLYYYEKFGKICSTGYCVDSFGHCGNLPQLLNLGGMYKYMFLRPSPSENPTIPDGPFYWKSTGNDSRVLAYHIYESYGESGCENLERKITKLVEKSDEKGLPLAMFVGVGNHGGGPTKGDIEFLGEKYNINDEENSEVRFSSTDGYFHSLCETLPDLPVYEGSLKHHSSGCYSATSLMKQLNRKAENMLYQAEIWDTLAAKVLNVPAHTEKIREAWNEVMFNQFHDIMCGCSIMEAYESVKAAEGHAIDIAEKLTNSAIIKLSRSIDTWMDGISEPVYTEVRHMGMPDGYPRIVTVFNPLSFSVKVPVRTYYQSSCVKNSKGEKVTFSLVRSSRSNDSHTDTVFLAEIPAFGYETYFLDNCDVDYNSLHKPIETDGDIAIENEFIKAVFSKKTGFITSLVSKETGMEYAENALAKPIVVDDSKSDTWAHQVNRFENDKEVMKLEKIELVEKSEMRAVVRTTHTCGKSYLTQEFILAKEQKTLRVKCKSDWQEKFCMLKMSFDIGGENCIDTAQIAGGFEKRTACGEEEHMQQWTSVTTHKNSKTFGLALVNDGKYSYSCNGSDLRITLLRNVIFADHFSDRPYADFNFTDEGMNRFEYGIYLFDGEAESSEVCREAMQFNVRPTVYCESSHKGILPQSDSFIKVTGGNVNVTAVKLCEDGSGDTVVRLYETKGINENRCMLMSDLLNTGFWFEIKAGEIKTFRICADGKVRDVNFLEGIVPPNETEM